MVKYSVGDWEKERKGNGWEIEEEGEREREKKRGEEDRILGFFVDFFGFFNSEFYFFKSFKKILRRRFEGRRLDGGWG